MNATFFIQIFKKHCHWWGNGRIQRAPFFETVYISNKKAHRWGAKLFVLAESRTGYTHQVSVYKGRRNTARHPHGQG